MTAQNEVAPKHAHLITPFRVLVTLVIVGLVLWNLNVFKRTPRVAIITSGDSAYWDQVEAGARAAASTYKVDFDMIRVKTDMLAQSDAIRNALNAKYDGIAISPIDPNAEASTLATVAAQTTLMTIDSDSPVARRVCFVGTDNYAAGRLMGQIIETAVPDGGEVIICLGNAQKQNTALRRMGVIDELLQRPFDPNHSADPLDGVIKGDKYSIVATIVDGADASKLTQLATDAITANPNVKCFAGLLAYSAPALATAIDKSGNTGKIQVVGFDVADATLAGIDSGAIAGTIMQDQFNIGYETVRMLADCAHGDTIQLPVYSTRTIDCKIVNKANLNDIRQHLAKGTT
jgi:ribose transport system substrate-binding protein